MTKRYILFLLLLTLSLSSFGQGGSYAVVRGRILSAATGQPQQYVTVGIAGTSQRALSDVDGYYIFENAPTGYQRLFFDGFGFEKFTSEPMLLTVAKPTILNYWCPIKHE